MPGEKKATARDRMLTTAVSLLSESGPRSVTIDRVLRESGAPRGSVYHHFPGGRDEIVALAARTASDVMTGYFRTIAAENTPLECIDLLTDFWKAQLAGNKYAAGCPILATTVDDGDAEGLHEIVQETFGAWTTLIFDVLVAHDVPETRARSIATLTVASVEGGIAVSKAIRSTEPLDEINAELKLIVAGVIDG